MTVHQCAQVAPSTGERCTHYVYDTTPACAAGHANPFYSPPAVADTKLQSTTVVDIDQLLAAAIGKTPPTTPAVGDQAEAMLAELAGDPTFVHAWDEASATGADPLLPLVVAAANDDGSARELVLHVASSTLSNGDLLAKAKYVGPPPNWTPLLYALAVRQQPHSAKAMVRSACEAGVPAEPIAEVIAELRACRPEHVAMLAKHAKLSTEEIASLATIGSKRFRFAATAGYIEGLIMAGHEPRAASRHVVTAMLDAHPALATDNRFLKAISIAAHGAGGSAPTSPIRTAILEGAADAGVQIAGL